MAACLIGADPQLFKYSLFYSGNFASVLIDTWTLWTHYSYLTLQGEMGWNVIVLFTNGGL